MRTWVGVLVLAAGCASVPIRTAEQPRLAAADARVLEGCYDCLIDARQTFEQLAVGRARPFVVPRLFEVNVLIGLREGELALEPGESFSRAEALLPELSPTVDSPLLLEIAKAIPPDSVGTPRADMRQGAVARREVAARSADIHRGLNAAQVSVAFRDYLSASFTCLTGPSARPGSGGLADVPPDAAPLVRYRLATCPILRPDPLQEVLDATPAFVEAGVFLTRTPVRAITGVHLRRQILLLTNAYERLSHSPSVTYALGSAHQTLGDCRTALQRYDETLALKARHETAALQRVICLGFLAEHDNAIAAATQIVNERFDNIGEAYYWRAWNHYKLDRLPPARADIDRALALRVNAQAYTLGGMIKYAQGELELAHRDLTAALVMAPGYCLARWYLGLVTFDREEWGPSGDAFQASAVCYKNAADMSLAALEEILANELDPDFKAMQIASFEAAIRDERAQEQASYLNAANGFARSERPARALDMLTGIPADSAHADAARQLREYLEKIIRP